MRIDQRGRIGGCRDVGAAHRHRRRGNGRPGRRRRAFCARAFARPCSRATDRPAARCARSRSAGRPIDVGPTVLTMRWVFEQIFDEAGADPCPTASRLRRRRAARPPRLGRRRAARPLFRHRAQRRRDRRASRARARPRAIAVSAARAQAIYETLRDSFIGGSRAGAVWASPRASVWRMRPISSASRPSRTLWRALGEHFADPRLRQLFGRYATYCGSSPFLAPGDADARRPCRARWRLARRGRHGAVSPTRSAISRAARGAEFRFGRRVDRIVVERRPGRRRRDRRGRARSRRTPSIWNGDVVGARRRRAGPEARARGRRRRRETGRCRP